MTKQPLKYYTNGAHTGSAMFSHDKDHWDFVSEAMKQSITANPLHIDEFIYVSQQEAEIIRWTLDMYNGNKDSCGILTGGGTESILLAMLAYREKFKAERGVTKPNIVMSDTAHAAFDKAAFYFGIEVRKVPITADYRCDFAGIRK